MPPRWRVNGSKHRQIRKVQSFLLHLPLGFYIFSCTAPCLHSEPGDFWCVTVFATAGGTVPWRVASLSVFSFLSPQTPLVISLTLHAFFSKLSHLTLTLNVQATINNKLTLNIYYVIVKIRYKNCASAWLSNTVQSALCCCHTVATHKLILSTSIEVFSST